MSLDRAPCECSGAVGLVSIGIHMTPVVALHWLSDGWWKRWQ